jgi:hypothetical protein
MNMLYDSENFCVVHTPSSEDNKLPSIGAFEIFNKVSNIEVFLSGTQADLFNFHINMWKIATPTAEAVEETLDQFSQLGTLPLIQH